ncbi:MAG: hypothetical protein JST84_04685 [Acidobacteria bacterium]|nr:hypothetical protein [Acidobacteriota bacterium]
MYFDTPLYLPLPGELQTVWHMEDVHLDRITSKIKAFAHPFAVANAPRKAAGYFLGSTSSGKGLPNDTYRLTRVEVYYWQEKPATHTISQMVERFGMIKL